MSLAKGARHSCRLNVYRSNAFEKQETSDLPKTKRYCCDLIGLALFVCAVNLTRVFDSIVL